MLTQPAFWIWLLATITLAGVFIIGLLLFPGLEPMLGRFILGAVAAAALIAAPFSMMAAKAIR